MSEEPAEYNMLPIQMSQEMFVGIIDEAVARVIFPPAEPLEELFTALVAAQLEIENAEALTDNEFTKKKYADLASVMNAVREPLAKNGLVIIQLTADESATVLGIRTILAHESGQSIEDVITMSPPKLDPQGVGSCRTYMRRYAVLAMCGIAGAVDDDAEGARIDPDEYVRLSPTQIDEILVLADKLFRNDADAKVNRMLDKAFQVTAVGDIPADLFDQAINLLNNQSKREKAEAKPKPKAKPPTTESKPEPGADG